MTKRIALVLAVCAAAVTLLGATGCTKKKMMGSVERPNHATHAVS
jgi:hypothetical protein